MRHEGGVSILWDGREELVGREGARAGREETQDDRERVHGSVNAVTKCFYQVEAG